MFDLLYLTVVIVVVHEIDALYAKLGSHLVVKRERIACFNSRRCLAPSCVNLLFLLLSSGEAPAGHWASSPFVKLRFLSVPLLGPGGAGVCRSGDGSFQLLLLLLLQRPPVYRCLR